MQMDIFRSGINLQPRWSQLHQLCLIWLQGFYFILWDTPKIITESTSILKTKGNSYIVVFQWEPWARLAWFRILLWEHGFWRRMWCVGRDYVLCTCFKQSKILVWQTLFYLCSIQTEGYILLGLKIYHDLSKTNMNY